MAELGQVYDDALRQIEKDIKKIFHAYVKGYGIPPGEAEKLLSQKQTKEIREKLLALLEQTDDPAAQQRIRAVLDAPAYAYRISKLEALRSEAFADAASIGLAEIKYLQVRLADTYKESYYRTVFDLSRQAGLNVPFRKLSNRQAEAAILRYWSPGEGKTALNYSARVWNNSTELAENVRKIITKGILTGASYGEMMDELSAAMGAVEAEKRITPDGKSRVALTGSGHEYRSSRLVRTENNYISGQARMLAYQEAGIKQYIFRANLELKTCKTCGELDGQVFPVAEQTVGVNMHPMHPHCFCYTAPYREQEVLNRLKRAAQIAPDEWDYVPQGMTYQEWRKKYVDGSPEMLEAEKAIKRPKKKKQEPESSPTPKPHTPMKPQAQREKKPVKVEPKRWQDVQVNYKTKNDE